MQTSVDPANCGACGTACPTGYGCTDGACVFECNGTNCNGQCVDTDLDPNNCGACGHACTLGQSCTGGACVTVCGPGTQNCSGACKDTAVDPANCGACGHTCSQGEVCSGGACVLNCGGGATNCGGACVDVQNDPAHCGACGTACGAGMLCVAGQCAACPAGRSLCNGQCVDTQSDVRNCGSCAHACSYGGVGTTTCEAGTCTVQCSANYGDCQTSGYCSTYLLTDSNNCGACGVVCPANQYCSSGNCVSCAAGLTRCGYQCVDLTSSYSNCGACNNYCSDHEPYTQSLCVSSTCTHQCYQGYVDCNGTSDDGCEVNVNADPLNCGTCGVKCAAGERCVSGVCQSCPSGQSVCNGYCVDLTRDSSNCGACGVSCGYALPHASTACTASTCTFTCGQGYLDCDGNVLDGCETHVGAANCGACGTACGSDEFCNKTSACATCSATDLGSTVPQTVTGTTVGHLDQLDTSCGYGNAPEVYYSFTAPATGAYTFDTLGSAFRTVLEVHQGTCTGTRLACKAQASGTTGVTVTLNLTQDEVVTLIIDGSSGSQGNYTLHITQ